MGSNLEKATSVLEETFALMEKVEIALLSDMKEEETKIISSSVISNVDIISELEKIKRAKGELEIVVLRNNQEFIITNGSETTFTVECEDYLEPYKATGVPTGRVFANQVYVVKDFVVKVKNINEIGPIATKIKNLYPDCKVTTRDDLKRSYEQMFNYKSGIFLALFVISLFTFFIIIYDRSSTLLSEEKQEIGILKAVGWSTNDILKWKFYESSIISVFSFCFGVM